MWRLTYTQLSRIWTVMSKYQAMNLRFRNYQLKEIWLRRAFRKGETGGDMEETGE